MNRDILYATRNTATATYVKIIILKVANICQIEAASIDKIQNGWNKVNWRLFINGENLMSHRLRNHVLLNSLVSQEVP